MIESYNLCLTWAFKNNIPEYRGHLDDFETLGSVADPLEQTLFNVFLSLTYLSFK